MNRAAWSVTLLSLLVLAASVGPAVGVESTEAIAGTQLEPDDVLLQVDLQADGTASWTVEYRIRLDDENTSTAFDSVQADVEANESAFAEPFAERMGAAAADAENTTGREMAIENVTVTAERRQLPQEYGVITYRFEWVGFATVADGEIRAGDAISGFFLDQETTLLVTWPEGYGLASVTPAADEERASAVVWNGPTDFATTEPRIVVSQGAAGGDGSDGGDDGTQGGLSPVTVGVGVAVAVAVAAGAAFALRRRDEVGDAQGGSDAGGDPGGDDPGTGGDGGAAAATDVAAESGDGADAGGGQEPPPELMSNEERVLRLIRDRGGRLKQQEVAQALDWTDAKTSQVVRKMRDDGQLEGFRLGRENVLALPEESEETP